MATKPKHEWIGLSSSESRKASSKYREYAIAHSITTASDKPLLESYVYVEIMRDRIQEQIKKISDTGNKTTIPKDLLNQYYDATDQMIMLGEKLGFNENKKESSFLKFWSKIKEKAQRYAVENRGLCTAKCPYCQKLFLLLKKVDDYDSFDFTMFRGTLLYNKVLMEFIESGKLTMEEVSKIFGLQNTDYIKGIYNKVYLKEKSSFK
jgi:hypothetical protein